MQKNLAQIRVHKRLSIDRRKDMRNNNYYTESTHLPVICCPNIQQSDQVIVFFVVLQDQSLKSKPNQAIDLILVPVPFVLFGTSIYLRSKLQISTVIKRVKYFYIIISFQILRKAKTRVIVKRFLNRECSNH